jgi:hypothetical protein
VFLGLFADHEFVLEGAHLLHQELFQFVRVLLDLFLELGHLCHQCGQILGEDVVQFAGLGVELLNGGGNTIAESRWDLALPDCSPRVLVNYEVRSFDICITYYKNHIYTSPGSCASSHSESKSLLI